MSEKKKSGVKKAFTTRLERLASNGRKAAHNGLEHLSANGKKAVQNTNEHFKNTVDNGIAMSAAKKINSSPKMPAWTENYVEKLLTGEEKVDIEYE